MTASSPVITRTNQHVTTLTMNDPDHLNGWTRGMLRALEAAVRRAAKDDDTRVLVLTGAGRYYSAGVNLSGALTLGHPRALRAQIIEQNQALFELFLDFPKPILVAVNGPAIGAPVTSATLCDAIIAGESATFLTPFHRLGVTPEGCSSIHFERLMGRANAERMLGPEAGSQRPVRRFEAGLVTQVVADDRLMDEAQRLAEEWARSGKTRSFRGGSTREELKAVNARESIALADAFLSPHFLGGQARFLWSKKKRGPALMFLALRVTHPAWSLLLRD